MKKLFTFFCALLVTSSVSQAAEQWREKALIAADHLALTIEALDETLHEVYDQHKTPAFKKAVTDIHHIEALVEGLMEDLPAASFPELCEDFSHLYEDLVEIRLDLIALGLQGNPQVVRTWNNMANTYNRELNPFFRNCSHHWSADSVDAGLVLELL